MSEDMVAICRMVRGDGYGNGVAASGVVGVPAAYLISENSGVSIGLVGDVNFKSSSSDESSAPKFELIGDRVLMMSLSASPLSLLPAECRLMPCIQGLKCVYQKYWQTRHTSTKT